MDRKDRLSEAFTYLKNKGMVHTQKDLANIIGASAQNVSSALKGVESVLTDSFLKRFNSAFDNVFNIDWLISEKGEMLNSTTSQKSSEHIIKYYPDVDGNMGGLQFLENPNETALNISIPGYSDCKYAINAYGDSMYPLIQSGQIVLLVPWTENFIEWGRIYLIITRNGHRSIKRLFPAKDAEHILCKSENSEEYPPFEVERDAILNVFLVKGWICRNEI